jgi:hypothetical protein
VLNSNVSLAVAALLLVACNSSPPPTGSTDAQDTGPDVCYSPTMNQTLASQRLTDRTINIQGCSCVKGQDADQCVPLPDGGKVALVCFDGRWMAVVDGPCWGWFDAGTD